MRSDARGTTALISIFKTLFDVLGGVLQIFTGDFDRATDLTKFWLTDWAASTRGIMLSLSITLVVLKVVVESWKIYIARDAGEMTPGPMVLLRRAAYVVAAIALSGWAVEWLYGISKSLGSQIGDTDLANMTGATAGGVFEALFFGSMLYLAKALQSDSLQILKIADIPGLKYGVIAAKAYFVLIFAIPIFFGFLLWLQSILRSMEMTLIYMFGPAVAALGFSEADDPRGGPIGVMGKELLVLSMTNVVQVAIGLAIFSMGSWLEFVSVLMRIPLFWVALRAPTWLRSMVYGSPGGGGSSEGVGAGAAGAGMARASSILRAAPF